MNPILIVLWALLASFYAHAYTEDDDAIPAPSKLEQSLG